MTRKAIRDIEYDQALQWLMELEFSDSTEGNKTVLRRDSNVYIDPIILAVQAAPLAYLDAVLQQFVDGGFISQEKKDAFAPNTSPAFDPVVTKIDERQFDPETLVSPSEVLTPVTDYQILLKKKLDAQEIRRA